MQGTQQRDEYLLFRWLKRRNKMDSETRIFEIPEGLQDEDTESLCDTIIMFKTECPDTEIVMHGLI